MSQEIIFNQKGYRPKKLACHECETVLDISSFKPLDPIFCPNCKTEMVVPAKLGIYDLYQFLGEGAMGRVYLARDPVLNRDVAIKILRRDLNATPKMWTILENEAKAAAGINHSNVIHIFAMGKVLGRPYIVMELADYASLEDLIEKSPITEPLALSIGIDVMKGLQAAYEHQLIHGDIKPANILITHKNEAKITDFGLARFLKEGQEVERWGTPYYIAPEKSERIREDFRSDMYSLGATLYHALAGKAPYEGETGEEVIAKSLKAQADSLNKVAADVSKELSELISKMMEKNPDHRFLSYEQAIVCFQNLQDGLYELGTCKKMKAHSGGSKKFSGALFDKLVRLVVDK